jgi:hypothetical protein
VNKFFLEAEKHGVNVSIDDWSIEFADLDHRPAHGLTIYSRKLIQIDPESWEVFNETRRELLIFHELGHAILNRRHIEWGIPHPPDTIFVPVGDSGYNFVCSTKPVSIMCPGIGSQLDTGGHYYEEYEYYMNELFNGRSFVVQRCKSSLFNKTKKMNSSPENTLLPLAGVFTKQINL